MSLYADPRVEDISFLVKVTFASDPEHEPEMRGELVDRINQLSEDTGCDFEVLTESDSVVCLSGGNVIETRGEPVEVRQYHRDFMEPEEAVEDPSGGSYVVVSGPEASLPAPASGPFVATLDTGGISYSGDEIACIGATEAEARERLAAAFADLLANRDNCTREQAIEHWLAGHSEEEYDPAEGETDMVWFAEELNDYYGIRILDFSKAGASGVAS